MKSYPPLMLSWTMWGLVVILYLIGFFQRVAPAVMSQELMSDFQLGGALLGNLSATYFYAYAAMQIPSGLLADHIGPRRLATYACAVATIGIFVFSFGTTLWFAYIGRFLVGASVRLAGARSLTVAGTEPSVMSFVMISRITSELPATIVPDRTSR